MARADAATKAVAGVGLASVAAYLVVVLQRIGYPYELTYFEGSTVEVAGRVAAGQSLYGPPTTEYTPWPYPPLYFWLTGALAKLTGVDLTTMRVVSVAASVAVLVLLALIVRRAGGSTVAGIVAAGLYAATYRVSGAFADTARVDSLLLALLLAAVFVGMRARTWRGGVGLGGMLLLAFLTKQNALLVAAPMLLWLLVRRRGVGVGATTTLGIGVVASTLVGNVVTDGWYARYVVEQLPTQSWSLRWLWAFWWEDLLLPFAVSAAVVVVAFVVRRVRPGSQRGERDAWPEDYGYLAACAVGMLAASWVARLHEGGAANVAMPAQAAAAGALGLLLARWLRSGSVTATVAWVVAALLAVQVVTMSSAHLGVVPSQEDRDAGDRFIATLRQLPGTVLVPTHPYYLRLAGLPTHASAIAIYDLSHAKDGPEHLSGVLPWSLAGVNAVVLDNATDVGLFGDALTRDFTLVTSTVVPDGVFLPETDLPTHPALLYVRTTALLAGDGSRQLSAATSPSKR
ncbi:MAG TPA: glycosyltransferase family 39 protein [Lapillicoccus sp.]|uniref:glycosyltransferase family 39 protein n=1 Tax=Lapillicoccus sp. TaxID=1909287 RepID=UPI002F932630